MTLPFAPSPGVKGPKVTRHFSLPISLLMHMEAIIFFYTILPPPFFFTPVNRENKSAGNKQLLCFLLKASIFEKRMFSTRPRVRVWRDSRCLVDGDGHGRAH